VIKGAETHERILGAAVRLVSRDGFDGLSIGALAEELALSKSGLFAHFGSKDELRLQTLQAAVDRFANVVVRPAFGAPRGEARVRALFRNWMVWGNDDALPGGCPLIVAAVELDDQPGPERDLLMQAQREWMAALARAVKLAVEVGDFRRNLDAEQFAFELYGIILGYNHARRLLHDMKAEKRARAAFDRLVRDARR
jgi:AcrR family transcriptional regulator